MFLFTRTVLVFFIAGLLFLCLEHVKHWERIASRRRPAFSSHLSFWGLRPAKPYENGSTTESSSQPSTGVVIFDSDAHVLVSFSTSGGTVTLASVNRRGPPISTLLPSTKAFAPRPGSAPNFVADNWTTLRRLASVTIALASGCSELDSTAAARAIKSSSVVPVQPRLPTLRGSRGSGFRSCRK